MPGHAPHSSRGRVVDDSPQHHLARRGAAGGQRAQRVGAAAGLCGGDARRQRGWGIEHRVAHTEWREHAAPEEGVEWRVAHARHDFAEQKEIDVAVNEPPSRGRGQRLLGREMDRGVRADPGIAKVQIRP